MRPIKTLLVASFAIPSLAAAADMSWYVGASYADLSRDPRYLDFPPSLVGAADEDNEGFKLLAGWRPRHWLAIEATYMDLGSQRISLAVTCPGPGCPLRKAEDSRALSLTGLALFRTGPVELFARAGFARWTRKSVVDRAFDDPLASSQDEEVFTYGAGLQYPLRRIAIRLEYETLGKDDLEMSLASLGITWSFP